MSRARPFKKTNFGSSFLSSRDLISALNQLDRETGIVKSSDNLDVRVDNVPPAAGTSRSPAKSPNPTRTEHPAGHSVVKRNRTPALFKRTDHTAVTSDKTQANKVQPGGKAPVQHRRRNSVVLQELAGNATAGTGAGASNLALLSHSVKGPAEATDEPGIDSPLLGSPGPRLVSIQSQKKLAVSFGSISGRSRSPDLHQLAGNRVTTGTTALRGLSGRRKEETPSSPMPPVSEVPQSAEPPTAEGEQAESPVVDTAEAKDTLHEIFRDDTSSDVAWHSDDEKKLAAVAKGAEFKARRRKTQRQASGRPMSRSLSRTHLVEASNRLKASIIRDDNRPPDRERIERLARPRSRLDFDSERRGVIVPLPYSVVKQQCSGQPRTFRELKRISREVSVVASDDSGMGSSNLAPPSRRLIRKETVVFNRPFEQQPAGQTAIKTTQPFQSYASQPPQSPQPFQPPQLSQPSQPYQPPQRPLRRKTAIERRSFLPPKPENSTNNDNQTSPALPNVKARRSSIVLEFPAFYKLP